MVTPQFFLSEFYSSFFAGNHASNRRQDEAQLRSDA